MNKILFLKELTGIVCVIILFLLMAGCHEELETIEVKKENENVNAVIESQYINTINILKERVWTRNRNTTKISQIYLLYSGTHDVDAFFYLPDDKKYVTVGFGNLINGVLEFIVPSDKIKDDNLIKWDLFKSFFTSEAGVGAWKNVQVIKSSNTEIKGNLLLLDAYTTGDLSGGMMDRQKFIGDRASLSCETILYFYINEDCTIIGNSDSGYRYGDSYYRAGNNLYLPLKKGWNLVTRTEKYSTDISGYAIISMEIKPIKNPQDYKWVIETGFRL